jgi:hypothetical protein
MELSSTIITLSRPIERQQFHLGHLFDGVAQTLTADAGVFDPAVGHMIDPEGGDIVDHQAADLDAVKGILDMD